MADTKNGLDLDAISRRHKAFEDAWDFEYMAADGPGKAAASAEDVPALVAEVRRLRAENIDLNLIVANRRPTGTGHGPRCPRCGEHRDLHPTWAVCPPCAVAEGWKVA